jgi:hypothetical protein
VTNKQLKESITTLLEDITSGDSTRVWSSSCAIIKLRNAEELDALSANLPEIKKKTANLNLGGALFPNREHLKFAIRKLEYYKNRTGCLCRLYPKYQMYDPRKEHEAGNVYIESDNFMEDEWMNLYICRCTLCGTVYQVEEREYHYTWWGWKPIAKTVV